MWSVCARYMQCAPLSPTRPRVRLSTRSLSPCLRFLTFASCSINCSTKLEAKNLDDNCTCVERACSRPEGYTQRRAGEAVHPSLYLCHSRRCTAARGIHGGAACASSKKKEGYGGEHNNAVVSRLERLWRRSGEASLRTRKQGCRSVCEITPEQ